MKKIAVGVIASAILAFGAEVKIGVILPMSGAIGGFGQSAWKGLELINSVTPKLKNGDDIKLILLDTKSDKIEAANAMEKLISNENVDAVIGELTSTNTLAITKIAEDKKVPLVAPVATNPRVTQDRTYTSRVCFNDNFQGIVGANFAYNELKAKSAAIIIDSKSDYSIGLAKAFEDSFSKLGGKIVKKALISAGDKDFKAHLSNIKSANPDLIYIPIYSNEAALIAIQAKQLGIKKPFLGGDGIAADKIFFEAGKDAIEGFMATDYYSADAKQTKKGEEFNKLYKEKYNEKTHTFAAMSADAYNVIVEAMNKCQNPKDRECVNKNIRSTKDFEGVSGIITIVNGDAVRSAVITEAKNGEMVYKATVNP